MAEFAYERRFPHPYSRNNHVLYQHFRETTYTHAPRSASAVPFAWMMKGDEGSPDKATALALGFRPEIEPDLGFESIWVQDRRNQLAMLDTFFGAIEPEASLAFFYAKKTPLTEDPRRVIVGIGRVTGVGPATEYAYDGPPPEGALRSMVWERNIAHSITPEIGDGFLLPYNELLALAAEDPDLDLAPLVLHAPEEHWDAFSMGSEHVSHDQAVSVLLSAAAVVGRYEALLPGDWGAARRWIDGELNRLWRLRGAFPGLGSALSALGLQNGTLLAHAVGSLLHADGGEDVRDPWPVVETVLNDPTLLPADLQSSVGPASAKLWKSLSTDRRALLKLLARFELSAEQVTRWWVQEERASANIALDDGAILANPYLCFEADRGRLDSIPLRVIDRGLFADPQVLAAVPVPKPSGCSEAIDPRRGRALIVDALERAADDGHTLLPQDWVVQRVREAEVSPPCAIGGDWISAFKDTFEPVLTNVPMASGFPAWQLDRYAVTRELINSRVRRRLSGVRHEGEEDWRGRIDTALGGGMSAMTEATGVGMGVVVDGRPMHGALHPEAGHLRVRRLADDAFPGRCPWHGDCLEGLICGPALAERIGGAADGLEDTHPVFGLAGAYLGEALAAVALTVSPQKIVVGGGVGRRPAVLSAARAAFGAALAGYIEPRAPDGSDLMVAPALGGHSGLFGAFALALDATEGLQSFA